MQRDIRKLVATVGGTLVAAAAAGFGAIVPAHADITVNCTGFPLALLAEPAGSVITLDNGGVLCTGGFTIPTGKNLTIQGNTQADGFDGGGANQSLTGTDNGATMIRNLTFKNGVDNGTNYGGAINLKGNVGPTISNCIFLNNSATNAGGAVYVDTSKGFDITLSGNVFGGAGNNMPNTAGGFGGGAALFADHVTVNGNQFLYNSVSSDFSAEGGGGIQVIAASKDANSVVFTGNTLVGNSTAGSPGGGAFINSDGGQTIVGNTFRANVINFTNQTSSNEKGAGLDDDLIPQNGGSTTITQAHNVFDANVIHGGVNVPKAAPRSSTPADYGGAGEYVVSPTVNSLDDTYTGNHVESSGNQDSPIGGGLAVQGTSNFAQPKATRKSTLTAYNMVVVNNTVGTNGEGGGIYTGFTSGCQNTPCTAEGDIFDSTIADNTVGSGTSKGPQIAGDTTDVANLVNDIVIGPVGSQTDVEGFGTFTATYTDTCQAGAAVSGTGNICKDPQLKNVPGNDVHQTSASPTVDAGNSSLVPSGLTQDYEGDPRISGPRVDMGAEEVEVVTPTLPLAGQSDVLVGSVVLWLGGFGLVLVLLLAGGAVARYRWGRRQA